MDFSLGEEIVDSLIRDFPDDFAPLGNERGSVCRTRRAHLSDKSRSKGRPRRTRNPIITSNAAFNPANRGIENNFFDCPHHKHEVLATVVGLPQAEQTFTCRIEVFFPGKGRT